MKLGHVASHSVVQIVIAWNREGLGTFPPPSREAFACNRRRCLRTRLGVINPLIVNWPRTARFHSRRSHHPPEAARRRPRHWRGMLRQAHHGAQPVEGLRHLVHLVVCAPRFLRLQPSSPPPRDPPPSASRG